MQPLVSCVVLMHDQLECTRRCLPSLLLSTWRPLEIVAVDNGSTDGTAEWLGGFEPAARAAGARLRILPTGRNAGCSTARNLGLAESRGEVVAFMDNDTAVRTRSWVERFLDAFRDPSVAMAGAKLLFPWEPFPIECAGCDVTRDGWVVYRGRGEPREDPRCSERREVQALISAWIASPRRWLLEAGGFDEAFNPIQFEDIDLCYRLRGKGGRILYLPEVEHYHSEGGTSTRTSGVNYRYVTVKNGAKFKERWRAAFAREGGPERAPPWREVERRPPAEPLPITD